MVPKMGQDRYCNSITSLRSLFIILILYSSVKFSFCPKPPRMVRHYGYEKAPKTALTEIRAVLESEEYKIIEFAPEDGFMVTDYKINYWGKNQFQFAIIVHVKDKITFTGMGKLDLPVASLGDSNNIMETQTMDRLPYRLQREVFSQLDERLNKLGYYNINHWP